jgi:hypothetical protein
MYPIPQIVTHVATCFRVLAFGFRVSGVGDGDVGFSVLCFGLGFEVEGLGCGVWGLGFGV